MVSSDLNAYADAGVNVAVRRGGECHSSLPTHLDLGGKSGPVGLCEVSQVLWERIILLGIVFCCRYVLPSHKCP